MNATLPAFWVFLHTIEICCLGSSGVLGFPVSVTGNWAALFLTYCESSSVMLRSLGLSEGFRV